jgi:5-methylcytosine-specific restriction protein B
VADFSNDSVEWGNMPAKFTWIPIYEETASELVDWENRQTELISFLEQLRADGLKITPLTDQDEEGARFLLKVIDPFSFFGVFNRGIKNEQRLNILAAVKKLFGLKSELPTDFAGIPVLNNQRSWFFAYQNERKENDIPRLWRAFRLALGTDPLHNADFLRSFDEALEVKGTNFNLTIGLFWIRPNTFLNLDQNNRRFLKVKLPSAGLSAKFYVEVLESALTRRKPLPELSYEAWEGESSDAPQSVAIAQETPLPSENNYWMLGAYWSDHDPPDLTQRFLDEGIWKNGYKDRYLDEVRAMKVGDKIAIKATFTQRHNLPFDSKGKTVSKMVIKAIGTVVKNRGDGRTLEVEWDPAFKAKDWYFYTNQTTVWRLRRESQYARRLIDFAFGNAEQDYDWFCEQWWGSDDNEEAPTPEVVQLGIAEPYSLADILASGVFMREAELQQALDRLRSKMNLILTGAPGVGKNFLAKKLAYTLMQAKDDNRVSMVQFHQSYSYEDFIRGYRPRMDKGGGFELQDGAFYAFCTKAKDDPDRAYVFIIDEINRGNLSQIFGELLMLIEADKRGPENAMPLVYKRSEEERFYIPKNVYLIGLMNVADRSLAMVDYALRRRFAFFELRPQYSSDRFSSWLRERNMPQSLIDLIVSRMAQLNKEIAEDILLGSNYQVGHSFFCPKGDDFAGLDRSWYNGIIRTEIGPLLREYWFDNQKKAEEVCAMLLA